MVCATSSEGFLVKLSGWKTTTLNCKKGMFQASNIQHLCRADSVIRVCMYSPRWRCAVEAAAVVSLGGTPWFVPGTRQHLAVHRLVSLDARRARHAAVRDGGPRVASKRAQRASMPARGSARDSALKTLEICNSNLRDSKLAASLQ